LHALGWAVTGRRDSGMLLAGRLGQGLALAVAAYGLVPLLAGGGSANLWALLISLFLWQAPHSPSGSRGPASRSPTSTCAGGWFPPRPSTPAHASVTSHQPAPSSWTRAGPSPLGPSRPCSREPTPAPRQCRGPGRRPGIVLRVRWGADARRGAGARLPARRHGGAVRTARASGRGPWHSSPSTSGGRLVPRDRAHHPPRPSGPQPGADPSAPATGSSSPTPRAGCTRSSCGTTGTSTPPRRHRPRGHHRASGRQRRAHGGRTTSTSSCGRSWRTT
jgi:hypothetical protein